MKRVSDSDAADFGRHFLEDMLDYISAYIPITCVYDDDAILDYVYNNFSIEDIFTPRDLEYWARENGYVEE